MHFYSLINIKEKERKSSPHRNLPCFIRPACTTLTNALDGPRLTQTYSTHHAAYTVGSSIRQSRLSKHSPSSPLKIQIRRSLKSSTFLPRAFQTSWYCSRKGVHSAVSSYDWKRRTNPIFTRALDGSPAPEVMWDWRGLRWNSVHIVEQHWELHQRAFSHYIRW